MCIKTDPNININSKSIDSNDPCQVQLVKDLVKSKISCCLIQNKLYPNNEDNDINMYDIDSDNNSSYSIESKVEDINVDNMYKYNYNPDLKTHFNDATDCRRVR